MALYIAVDFDGTIVSELKGPLTFMPGAAEGLAALKAAGHKLLLYSARANRSLRQDPSLDPMVRAGALDSDALTWFDAMEDYEKSYQEMVDFVTERLPGVFDAIDDGQQGKPLADLFIDDRAATKHARVDWAWLAARFGGHDVQVERR